VHANEKTTTEWYGFIIIIDPARSEIAKRANIVEPGAYAIRVRQ
jgi:DNA-directed RNA polymerase subunit E"